MRIVCIIPARGNSKGIPKKNLLPLANKPLLQWSISQALDSKLVDEVYVSSDSAEILTLAKKLGAKGIKRPADISGDTASSESALIHAYEEIKGAGKIDYIVFLQATSPVRKKTDIDDAIKKIQAEHADSLLSVKVLKDYFIWQKTEAGTFEPTNFDYKNRKRRQDLAATYLENGSIYVFKPEILIQNKNRLGGKICVYEMDPACSFQVDDPSDIKICEYFLTQLKSTKKSKVKK
jgi:CMP-N,N'-diacetyllegionaminic acid synthase